MFYPLAFWEGAEQTSGTIEAALLLCGILQLYLCSAGGRKRDRKLVVCVAAGLALGGACLSAPIYYLFKGRESGSGSGKSIFGTSNLTYRYSFQV